MFLHAFLICGHGLVLHSSFLLSSVPRLPLPSDNKHFKELAGGGLLQVRLLVNTPPPQLALHSFVTFHSAQFPGANEENNQS